MTTTTPMTALEKFRLLFFTTLVFSGLAFAIIWERFPRGYAWWTLGFVLLAAFFGLSALTSGVLFFTGIFVRSPEELWRSPWFRYMSGLWGDEWGKREYVVENDVYERTIDGCGGFWYSFFAFVAWLMVAGFLAAAFVLLKNVALAGYFLPSSKPDLLGNAFITLVFSAIALTFAFAISCGIFHGTPLDTRKTANACGIAMLAILFVIFFVVAPLHYMSAWQYGAYCLEVVVGGIFAVVIGICVWKILKVLFPLLGRVHVFRSLARGYRSFKTGTCVIIRENDRS